MSLLPDRDDEINITAGDKLKYTDMLFAHEGLTVHQASLARVYIDQSTKHGHCFSGQEYLKFRSGLSDRTQTNANSKLEELGLFRFAYHDNHATDVFPIWEALELAYCEYVERHQQVRDELKRKGEFRRSEAYSRAEKGRKRDGGWAPTSHDKATATKAVASELAAAPHDFAAAPHDTATATNAGGYRNKCVSVPQQMREGAAADADVISLDNQPSVIVRNNLPEEERGAERASAGHNFREEAGASLDQSGTVGKEAQFFENPPPDYLTGFVLVDDLYDSRDVGEVRVDPRLLESLCANENEMGASEGNWPAHGLERLKAIYPSGHENPEFTTQMYYMARRKFQGTVPFSQIEDALKLAVRLAPVMPKLATWLKHERWTDEWSEAA